MPESDLVDEVRRADGSVLKLHMSERSNTGYKYVHFHEVRGKFLAQARVQGTATPLSLGYFDTAVEAATAYAKHMLERAEPAPAPAPSPPLNADGGGSDTDDDVEDDDEEEEQEGEAAAAATAAAAAEKEEEIEEEEAPEVEATAEAALVAAPSVDPEEAAEVVELSDSPPPVRRAAAVKAAAKVAASEAEEEEEGEETEMEAAAEDSDLEDESAFERAPSKKRTADVLDGDSPPFKRPRGRAPGGKMWDENDGQWVEESTGAMGPPSKRPAPARPATVAEHSEFTMTDTNAGVTRLSKSSSLRNVLISLEKAARQVVETKAGRAAVKEARLRDLFVRVLQDNGLNEGAIQRNEMLKCLSLLLAVEMKNQPGSKKHDHEFGLSNDRFDMIVLYDKQRQEAVHIETLVGPDALRRRLRRAAREGETELGCVIVEFKNGEVKEKWQRQVKDYAVQVEEQFQSRYGLEGKSGRVDAMLLICFGKPPTNEKNARDVDTRFWIGSASSSFDETATRVSSQSGV